MQHTKEPWNGKNIPLTASALERAGFYIVFTNNPATKDEAEANARRIVACVNACEGMDTESLESIAGRIAAKSALQMHAYYVSNKAKVAAMEQQRDKLLAVLTEIAELDILKYHHAYAIAKGAIEEIEALK